MLIFYSYYARIGSIDVNEIRYKIVYVLDTRTLCKPPSRFWKGGFYTVCLAGQRITEIDRSGQTRRMTFPTIWSASIQPIVVLRESMEIARLSPITKYRSSGTW